MSRKKDSAPFANIGVSSLLVIFIILCLVVFATLTLSTSKSDYTFTQKLAQHKAEYYEASGKAEEDLAGLDRMFKHNSPKGDSREISLLIRQTLGSECVCDTTDNTVSWQVPMGDSQALEVVIKTNWFYNKAGYTIKKWQTVSTVDQSEQTLNLLTTE